MTRLRFVSAVSSALLLFSVSALAEPAGAGGQAGPFGQPGAQRSRPVATEKEKLRLQIAAMEGVLSTAVHEIHSRQLENALPGLITFEGSTRARGFQLEGYGVFFDVDLPPLPRSVAWTLQVLDFPLRLDSELAQLRQQVASVSDVRLRQELDQTLRLIQRKVAAPGGTTVSGESGGTSERMVQARNEQVARPADPFASYGREIGSALADVLINYGGTITLGSDDWLTIAARESQPKLLPGGPVETAITLRIKGADLAAFKAGRLSAEEARKRVEIKEF